MTMKTKPLFSLLLCLLAVCTIVLILKQKTVLGGMHKPVITMVNFPTGITNTLLKVGATSFTFSVEWPPNMNIPRQLTLYGKLQPDSDGWDSLEELEIDPVKKRSVALLLGEQWNSSFPVEVYTSQNKAIFEIPYDTLFWNYMGEEKKEAMKKQAFFSVQNSVFLQRPLTREDIIQPEYASDYNKDWDRSREYAEVDLNYDDVKDIIISAPEYTRGKGGLSYIVYLCVGTNQYKEVGGIFGNTLALEYDYDHGGYKRIWSYSHVCSRSGTVRYIYFEDGEYKESPYLTICASEMETLASDYIFSGVCLEFNRTPLDDEKEPTEDDGKAVGEIP